MKIFLTCYFMLFCSIAYSDTSTFRTPGEVFCLSKAELQHHKKRAEKNDINSLKKIDDYYNFCLADEKALRESLKIRLKLGDLGDIEAQRSLISYYEDHKKFKKVSDLKKRWECFSRTNKTLPCLLSK